MQFGENLSGSVDTKEWLQAGPSLPNPQPNLPPNSQFTNRTQNHPTKHVGDLRGESMAVSWSVMVENLGACDDGIEG